MKSAEACRPSTRVGLFAAAATCALGLGCTTNLGDGGLGNYDKSTFVALSDPVVAMTISGSSLYWIDDTGSVWSCDKVACNDAPKRLYASSGAVGGTVQMGVSGDWLFWVVNQSLFGCPTAGCGVGPLAALATGSGATSGARAFAIDTAGGTGVYWFGAPTPGSGTPVLQYTPDCDGGCPQVVFQAPTGGSGASPTLQCNSGTDAACAPCSSDTDCPAGQFCTSYPGGPSPAACSPQLSPGAFCGDYDFTSASVCQFGSCQQGSCPSVQPESSSGLAVAGGQLYFASASQSSAVVSCPVSGCSLSTLTTYWAAPTPAGLPVLFGASANALYFSESEGQALVRCSLPTCAGTPADVASNVGPVLGFSSTDFYIVPSDSSFATACPFAGCAAGSPGVTPDPALDSTPLGVYPSGRPFAVDDAAIEWATSDIFGQTGNQIVRTPTP